MDWQVTWRADPVVRALADRHYSRKTIGATQFSPPGRLLVLRTADGRAAWVTHWPRAEYVLHAWPDAWVCHLFRNEASALYRSSDLIREAVAATRWKYGPGIPEYGMITFVDAQRVLTATNEIPGYCFRRAGFRGLGRTQEHDLVVLQLTPAKIARIEAQAPERAQLRLWSA